MSQIVPVLCQSMKSDTLSLKTVINVLDFLSKKIIQKKKKKSQKQKLLSNQKVLKTQTLLIKKSVTTGLQKNSHKLSITIRQAFEGFVGPCTLINNLKILNLQIKVR